MAEIWGAAIIAGGALVGGAMQSNAAKKAAAAGNAGAQAGIDEQRRQFDTGQRNIAPFMQYGQNAIGQMEQLNQGNYSGFMNSPDYQFALQQGFTGLNNGSMGNLWGGGLDADRIKLGQGLATQNLSNYVSRLQNAIGTGQNSAVGAGQLGQQSANQISSLYGNIGQNNSNSATNSGNAWAGALGGLANAAGQYMGGRQSSYAQPQQHGYGQPTSQWGQQNFQQPWYGGNYDQSGW